MKTFVTTSVRKLAKTSSTSKLTNEGYIIEFFDKANPSSKGTIFRSPKQILTDLIGSERLPATVTDWNNQRVSRAVSRMIGKPFMAEMTQHKAGDKYIVTAESSIITNPAFPGYGTVKVGDEATVANDGWRCESFINSRYTEEELDRFDRNEMLVDRMMEVKSQFENLFDSTPSTPASAPIVVEVSDDEADDLLAGSI